MLNNFVFICSWAAYSSVFIIICLCYHLHLKAIFSWIEFEIERQFIHCHRLSSVGNDNSIRAED
ncbi:hypothetical protein L211DRAFT_444883 [Terfezia boudieri ATCC MYA-4762]|uniref:Uncharacterized protein n=1 Tax=Terfezia boudieri ATCC MYA-4762 TaxID=1051890 RepID=A0A3N4LEU3_9PEZI|nr:hypothetical protein L211DRAFT_444883 [Terfezia boudieri ATCC MYA-4762]